MKRLLCNLRQSIVLASLGLLLSPPGTTWARAPEDSNLQYKEWFEGLRQPGTNSFCCSISDCHMTDYRVTDGGYEVPIDNRWVRVPPEKVLDHVANPTGTGVVCYIPPENIMCFVRTTEG